MRTLGLLYAALVFFSCNRKVQNSSSATMLKIDSTDNVTASSTAKATSIPSCIQQKIDSIKKEKVWNPPAQINEHEYNGRKVYLISAPCCDFFITAVDANCNYICAPSGGFTGIGDRKCPDFNKKAKFLRVVWKDERKVK